MKKIILIGFLILFIYYFFQSENEKKQREKETSPYNVPPDPNRKVVAYDFLEHRYIYEDDSLIKARDGHYVSPDKAPDPEPAKIDPKYKDAPLGAFDIPDY